MVHGRNRERRILNRIAQQLLVDAGTVDPTQSITTRHGIRLCVGDEVISRHGDRRVHPDGNADAWLRNGTSGTITAIERGATPDADRIEITTDDGAVSHCARAVFDRARGGIDLRYAVTSYAVQGETRDVSTSALTATTTRAELYVDITRGRHSNKVYATRTVTSHDDDRDRWLPTLQRRLIEDLANRMSPGKAPRPPWSTRSPLASPWQDPRRTLAALLAARRAGHDVDDAEIERVTAAIRAGATRPDPLSLSLPECRPRTSNAASIDSSPTSPNTTPGTTRRGATPPHCSNRSSDRGQHPPTPATAGTRSPRRSSTSPVTATSPPPAATLRCRRCTVTPCTATSAPPSPAAFLPTRSVAAIIAGQAPPVMPRRAPGTGPRMTAVTVDTLLAQIAAAIYDRRFGFLAVTGTLTDWRRHRHGTGTGELVDRQPTLGEAATSRQQTRRPRHRHRLQPRRSRPDRPTERHRHGQIVLHPRWGLQLDLSTLEVHPTEPVEHGDASTYTGNHRAGAGQLTSTPSGSSTPSTATTPAPTSSPFSTTSTSPSSNTACRSPAHRPRHGSAAPSTSSRSTRAPTSASSLRGGGADIDLDVFNNATVVAAIRPAPSARDHRHRPRHQLHSRRSSRVLIVHHPDRSGPGGRRRRQRSSAGPAT